MSARVGPVGLFDPSVDFHDSQVTVRDEAAYRDLMRNAVLQPSLLSEVDAAIIPDHCPDYDNLYLRASNLQAKAFFDPSTITTAEQIELAELRRELRDTYGVDVA